MIETRHTIRLNTLAVATFLLLGGHMVPAQASGAKAKPPAPDLHAGGAQPSSIPNDAETVVTLPGFHLSGANVTLHGVCKLVSYKVDSDNEIKMTITGARSIEDKDDTCSMAVKTVGGQASTWIVVELTDAQQQEQKAEQDAAGKAKAESFLSRSGKKWNLQFAGGTTAAYTSTGASPDGMPTFDDGAGNQVQIAVSDDGTVTMIESGCIRSGKLVGTEVKNGQSMGQCTPPGTWTATVER
ncbi:MAG TPA: hypothetical protein VGG45_16960 [Terracidiphilus sp.]|jgi:hypothetical protein